MCLSSSAASPASPMLWPRLAAALGATSMEATAAQTDNDRDEAAHATGARSRALLGSHGWRRYGNATLDARPSGSRWQRDVRRCPHRSSTCQHGKYEPYFPSWKIDELTPTADGGLGGTDRCRGLPRTPRAQHRRALLVLHVARRGDRGADRHDRDRGRRGRPRGSRRARRGPRRPRRGCRRTARAIPARQRALARPVREPRRARNGRRRVGDVRGDRRACDLGRARRALVAHGCRRAGRRGHATRSADASGCAPTGASPRSTARGEPAAWLAAVTIAAIAGLALLVLER